MARTAARLGGGTVDLDPAAFEAPFNMPLVHEAVRAELNARRHGTASTKTRGEVSGGGAKPWRQKGTGRARAGSSRSPVWTGGGTAFGPTPRRYTVKVNRKARRAALRSVLSLHAQRESLAVFDAGIVRDAVDPAGGRALDRVGRDRSDARAARPRPRAPPASRSATWPGPRRCRWRTPAWPTSSGRPRCSSPRRRCSRWWRSRRNPLAPNLRKETRPDGSHSGDHPAGPVREDVRPGRGREVHLPGADKAHKTQIRQAIEQLFEVNVLEVRTAHVHSKPKRRGQTAGRTRSVEEGDRAGARGPDDSDLRGTGGGRVNADS